MELAIDLDEMSEKNHLDNFVEKHIEFHNKMGEFTQNRLLVDSLYNINLFSLLLKAESVYQENERFFQYDHRFIVEAIVSGDPEHASEIVRKHIYRSGIVKIPLWCSLDNNIK